MAGLVTFEQTTQTLCTSYSSITVPLYLTEVGGMLIQLFLINASLYYAIFVGVGFRGSYGATSSALLSLLGISDLLTSTRRRRQSNDTSALQLNGTTFEGIDDPVTCIELGNSILFSITNESYPVYDEENLLNTNDAFDYGQFRQLAENQLTSGSADLFAYRFRTAGVYVFQLSNNPNRKMVRMYSLIYMSTGSFYHLRLYLWCG